MSRAKTKRLMQGVALGAIAMGAMIADAAILPGVALVVAGVIIGWISVWR